MNIKLFSTNCPKCKILEKKLISKNVKFELITDTDIILKKAEEIGVSSVPLLEIDGRIFDFAKANEEINKM